jgi:nitrate/nitrite transport system permease protein
MDTALQLPKAPGGRQSLMISLVLLGIFVTAWHLATRQPTFDPRGLSPLQLQQMEFNGDIVRTDNGQYIYNPEKACGLPGPWDVLMTAVEEFSSPFHKRGTNDHGIGHLIRYTVVRFAAGFLAASVVAVLIGVVIGLSRTLHNKRHIAGILFAILAVGAVGVALDAGFNRLARLVTYPE